VTPADRRACRRNLFSSSPVTGVSHACHDCFTCSADGLAEARRGDRVNLLLFSKLLWDFGKSLWWPGCLAQHQTARGRGVTPASGASPPQPAGAAASPEPLVSSAASATALTPSLRAPRTQSAASSFQPLIPLISLCSKRCYKLAEYLFSTHPPPFFSSGKQTQFILFFHN